VRGERGIADELGMRRGVLLAASLEEGMGRTTMKTQSA
jgi:hypothetical protein